MHHPLLAGFPIVIEIQVAWGEMDAYQHVNNVVYFRYFESARIVYAEKLGLHKNKDKTGIGPILASTSCKYRLPLVFPDTISVGAKTISIDEDRFTMKYAIVSHRFQKLAAEGEGVVVMYNYHEGKKTAIPEDIKNRILEIEKR